MRRNLTKLFKSNEVNSIISDNNFPNFLSVQEKHYVHMLNVQENTFLSMFSMCQPQFSVEDKLMKI